MEGRICCSCGKTYHYCPTCSRDSAKPTWMIMFCSDECHTVFDVLNALDSKYITNERAKELLSKIDLGDYSKYEPEMQKQLKDLFATEKVAETETVTGTKEVKESSDNSFKGFSKKKNK